MSETYEIERDLKEAEAMVKHLAPYLRSRDLYGNAGGGFFSKLPALTIGALVMRLRRLDILHDKMSASQNQRLANIQQQHQTTYREWKVHYEKKLLREAHSRIDAMKTFFEECHKDPRLCAQVYAPEVLRRTIVQEILLHMSELGLTDEDLDKKLTFADAQLRRYVRPSEFFWARELADETLYPSKAFWWLYNRPVGKEQ